MNFYLAMKNSALNSIAKELAQRLVLIDPLERGFCKNELKIEEFYNLIETCQPIPTIDEEGYPVFGNALTPEAIHSIESIF